MNIKEIKEMINLMKENDITEFDLEKNGFKVTLKRGQENAVTTIASPAPQMMFQGAPNAPQAAAPAAEADSAPAALPSNVKEILSPMVGTFYRSPSPEAKAYVQKGQDVSVDDTLCIIEAMKVMNEIKAEISGKIVDILVENGEPVEFNQPLFRVEIA